MDRGGIEKEKRREEKKQRKRRKEVKRREERPDMEKSRRMKRRRVQSSFSFYTLHSPQLSLSAAHSRRSRTSSMTYLTA
jgi:hypothetical protein